MFFYPRSDAARPVGPSTGCTQPDALALNLGEGYPAIVNPPLTLKICPVT
jgi:hypothetical protein